MRTKAGKIRICEDGVLALDVPGRGPAVCAGRDSRAEPEIFALNIYKLTDLYPYTVSFKAYFQ
jgi:hypothetical protein